MSLPVPLHQLRLQRVRRSCNWWPSLQLWRRNFSSMELGDGRDDERRKCLDLFGCAEGQTLSKEMLKSKYLELAKQAHPDAAGDQEEFQRLQRCFEMLSSERRKEPEWLRKLREDYATSKDPFP